MKKLATIYILLPVLIIMLFSGCLKKELVDIPEPISPIIDEVVISTSTEENIPVWPEQIYTEEDYIGWKTYVNEKLGYSIKYPADWTINACDEGCTSKEVIINPPDAEMFISYIGIGLAGRSIEEIKNSYQNPNYWEGKIYKDKKIIFANRGSLLLYDGPHKNNSGIAIKNNSIVYNINIGKDNNKKVLQALASFKFID
ncbi:MAG: hypothetical protein PF572_06190 [Patescibacteria group bacterium]|jgi:hypothetical protein|nr:hypothetical protein [Patescibacteria group bacterium]